MLEPSRRRTGAEARQFSYRLFRLRRELHSAAAMAFTCMLRQSCCRDQKFYVLIAFLLMISGENILFTHGASHGVPGDTNITSILNSLGENYNRLLRPNYNGPPVEVGVTLQLRYMSAIPESNMDLAMIFYLRQYWEDPRLAFKEQPGIESLSLGAEFVNSIWLPETFFVNEKQSQFRSPSTTNDIIHINHTGHTERITRYNIATSCSLDLQYFPMDRQLCRIEIESFANTINNVQFIWQEGHEDSVTFAEGLTMPEFRIIGHRLTVEEDSQSTGIYSKLNCDVQLARFVAHYLIFVYIPSTLIVSTSWISFFVHRNAISARVTLGGATVLGMMTMMTSANSYLPKSSNVKAIHIYTGFSFILVLSAFIEYAAIGYMGKRIQLRKRRRRDQEAGGRPASTSPRNINKIFGVTPSDLDIYSRILFPVTFICFNLWYWVIYLHISDVAPEDLVLLKT